MSISITIKTTSGADANGIDKNSASIILKNDNSLLDNKVVFFEVSDNALFADIGTNQTSVMTNALGRSTVYLTDTISEIVTITAIYSEDHSVKASGSSSFYDVEGSNIFPPKIDEAVNNIINLSDIDQIAHIRIPKWVGMKINDNLDIYTETVFPWTINYILKAADIENDIIIEISKSKFLEPYLNDILHLYYILNSTLTSETTNYLIVSALINDIEIIGNRGNVGSCHSLVAINKKTMTVSSVNWQYDNDDKIYRSPYFTDHHPLKRINVFINPNGNKIKVAPKNIESLGYENKSIAYILNNKGKLFFWGSNYPSWLTPPISISSLMSIDGVICSPYAAVVLTKEKNLYGWGSKGNGSLDVPINNVLTVGYTRTAFSAITEELKIIAWGHQDFGGNLLIPLNNIKTISSNTGAFTALNCLGQVYSWGQSFNGGSLPNNIQQLNNIVAISSSDAAFCILLKNGTIHTWGANNFGGKIPSEILHINNFISISSSTGGFSAISKLSTVVMWNNNNFKIQKNSIIKTKAGYQITRGTPPDTFISLFNNGTLSIIGENSDVSNINDIPQEVYGNVNHSNLNEESKSYNDNKLQLSSYIIKNNSLANGIDSNKILLTVVDTINKTPIKNMKLIISADGDALFLENNSSFLSKTTDSNGEVNISIINTTIQYINIIAFLSENENISLHNIIIFTE
ncbi:Ig-like domain-containing protein [Moellerella wisconsensis]|uniref:Ig-like domain-containing protein n=1 Tax=Moellerella wisconsensis TaxID=158849 RepID=UPI0030763EFA